MEFNGKWKSNMYSTIHGTFSLNVTDPLFATCKMNLKYSDNSTYRAGDSIDIDLEGVYREQQEKTENYRVIMRQIDLKMGQYFTLVMSSLDKVKWQGFLTCIFPLDAVKLFDIVMTDYVEKDQDQHITITI